MEFKETIKNAPKTLETPVAPAMPCKMSKNSQNWVTRGKSNEIKSKLACILGSSESTRMRMGESFPNHHEDHIAGKGDNSRQHYNLVHKFIPMPQAMKILAAKAAVDKEWENLTKVRRKKEVIDEARTKGAKVHFVLLMDICYLKNAELERKVWKIQRLSCFLRWYCERRLRVLRSIHWTRIFSISNDSSKSHGDHLQIARLRWTSSRLSTCLCPSKNGRCSHIIEKSKIGVSSHLDSSTTTQMAQIMVQYGRPSHSSWAKSVWSSFGRTVMGKAIRESSIEIRLGESFQLGMLIRIPWRRIFLINVCGWHHMCWKETKYLSDVESIIQKSWFGRTNIFPWSCISGMHSTSMRSKPKYCGQLQNHVRIANFRGWRTEITIPSKSSYFFMVLWHGWSCKEVCGNDIVSWQTKTTQQLHKVSTPCLDDHHFKGEEMKSVGELIVTSMLSNCSEMLLLCTNWTTWYSMVCK